MLYDVLSELNIQYSETAHKAVTTVEEAQSVKKLINGTGCKNLFLTDGKIFVLAVLHENSRADLRSIASAAGTSRLHFASEEELMKKLGLERGSVSPLGIINDKDHSVKLAVEGALNGHKLLMHPNVNTRTVCMDFDDLIKFIKHFDNEYVMI